MDALVDFLLSFYGYTPYYVVFGILLACGLGLPIPEDITLMAGGILVYYGICDQTWMIAICLGGVLVGDSIIFFLGARYGRRATRRWPFRRVLTEERLEYVSALIEKRGNRLIFAARFMPGLRAPLFFTAATLKVPFRVFLLFDGVAAVLSVPLIIGAVNYFGDNIDAVVRYIKRAEYGIVTLILLAALFVAAKWWLAQRKARAVVG